MRRTRSTGTLEDPIEEPERYTRAWLFFRWIKRAVAEEQNQKPLKDFALPSNEEPYSSIINWNSGIRYEMPKVMSRH